MFFILFSWYHHITKIRQYVGVFGDKKGKTADKKRKFAGAERHKNGTKAVLCAAFFAFSRHLPPAAAAPRAFAAPKDPPRNKFTRLPQNDRFCVSADRISPSFCAENLPVFSRAGKNPFLAPIPLFADRFPARRSPAGLLCALPHPRFCPSKQKKPARCRFSAACRTPPKEYFC